MTLQTAEFEINRRGKVYHRDTVMPDATTLGFTGDPNTATSAGNQSLLYYAAVPSAYVDKSATPFETWDKAQDAPGGLWVKRAASASSTDSSAIHKNAANEISGLTEKTSLADDDLFIVESSTDGGAKRKVKKSNLGGGGLDATGVSKNLVPMATGGGVYEWVAEGTTFTFSIASFTATGFSTGTQLIGTGNVNAIGSISFSATYNNGPATSGHINEQSSLNLGGTGFIGPTANTIAIAYPAAGGSVTLTLHAGDGTDFDTEAKTAAYQNVIRIAALDHGDTFTQADFDGAEVSVTTGDNTQTWSSVSLAAEYWVFMVPSRVGLPSYFYDNSTGFAIDMNIAGAETVSIENSLGFVEDYIIVASTYPLTYNMVGRTA